MEKILLIATNACPLLHGKPTGLWLSELTHFAAVVVDAGYAYDLASPLGGKIPIDERRKSVQGQVASDSVNARFMADPAFTAKLANSLKVSDLRSEDYVALYLSGGHGTMFDFRSSEPLQQMISQLWTGGKLLSGVCHGVSGFVDSVGAGGELLVRGKRVTGFSNFEDTLDGSRRELPFLLEDALKANGADYRKNWLPFTSRVETDGSLITGQNPQSARGVGEAVVEALASRRAPASK